MERDGIGLLESAIRRGDVALVEALAAALGDTVRVVKGETIRCFVVFRTTVHPSTKLVSSPTVSIPLAPFESNRDWSGDE